MRTQNVQEMIFDRAQNAWVAIGHQPQFRRAGLLVRAGRAIFGAVKAAILVALGVGACGLFFEQAPWYSRLWAAITDSFPWFWPF